jgi:hypothetical protein
MSRAGLRDRVIRYAARFLRTPLASWLLRVVFPRPTFVITTNPGAFLGNQLTIFAHVIASALDTGREIWGASFFSYARYFERSARDVCSRFPPKPCWVRGQRLRVSLYYYGFARLVRVLLESPEPPIEDVAVSSDYEGPQSLTSPSFVSAIEGKRVVLIEGYCFRTSMARIRKHAEAIKDYFRPLEIHERRAATVVRQARARGHVLVGVHLRQFDAVIDHTPHPLYRYEHARRMDRAMRRMVECFPGKTVVFLLCSNRAIDHGAFGEFVVAEGTGHVVEDLHALSLCDYLLASTYSTYSRWASFYGDVPFYQVDDPQGRLSLDEFRVQVPGIYDPSNEGGPIRV